jgi:putative salt-induced outer membrane protein
MKKIVLSTLAITMLTLTAHAEVAKDQVKLQADIATAKAQKAKAESTLKALQAQLPPNEQVMTNVKLGYIETNGNTETQNFSLDATIKKAFGKNNLSLILNGQYGSDTTTDTTTNISTKKETNNKYFVEGAYGYSFLETISFTYIIGYKNDKFSSYDYQSYTGPGLKYLALKNAKNELNLEASVLYSKDKLQINNPDFDDTYGSYRAKLNYALDILDNLKFEQEASYRASLSDSENYFVFSKSTLSSKLSDIFSAGVSYKVDYSNLVFAGLERTDTTLEVFLSIDY